MTDKTNLLNLTFLKSYKNSFKKENLKVEKKSLQMQKTQILLQETTKILNQNISYHSKNLALANILGNFINLNI